MACPECCDVCRRNAHLKIQAIRVAPVSHAICPDCEARGAEPLGLVLMWIFLQGDPDSPPGDCVHLTSHDDQTYIAWTDILAIYSANAGEFADGTRREFNLQAG